MLVLRKLKLFAFWLLVASCFAASAQAQTDLSGLWTGQSSGNQVTIEMRSGGFAIMVAGVRRSGQYGDGQFFRDAGSGLYLYTKPDGNNVRAQVLGPDSMQVTNPDGWTDVFRRAPTTGAGSSPASAPPASSQSSAQHQEPPGADAAAVADFHKSCAHLGDAATLAHYGNVFLEMRSDKDGPQKWRKTLPETVVSPYQCMLHVLLRHATNGVPGSVGDANSTVHPTPLARLKNTEVKQSEADAKYASEVAEYQRQLAAQQKAVADYNAAQRQMAADKAAAAARASAAQEEFARQQAAYQAEQDRYARERAEYESALGSPDTPWKQQGTDARIIASDGKSAMDCVKLIELTKTDSSTGGGGRVLSNQCSGPVEITWCYSPGDCDTETGAGWTVQAGKSWPVSADKNIRWAACHGANTAAFVKGSHGLSYYCKAPE